MDKLQAYSVDGVDFRECVSCGFVDQMRVFSEPRELGTRVNSAADLPENQISAVRLVDPE